MYHLSRVQALNAMGESSHVIVLSDEQFRQVELPDAMDSRIEVLVLPREQLLSVLTSQSMNTHFKTFEFSIELPNNSECSDGQYGQSMLEEVQNPLMF